MCPHGNQYRTGTVPYRTVLSRYMTLSMKYLLSCRYKTLVRFPSPEAILRPVLSKQEKLHLFCQLLPSRIVSASTSRGIFFGSTNFPLRFSANSCHLVTPTVYCRLSNNNVKFSTDIIISSIRPDKNTAIIDISSETENMPEYSPKKRKKNNNWWDKKKQKKE